MEHTVSAYLVECGAGLRYSNRHQDHLPLVYVRVGRAGDTGKGNLHEYVQKRNLMESRVLGDCWCHSKYTSSPLSLLFQTYYVAISVLLTVIFSEKIVLSNKRSYGGS